MFPWWQSVTVCNYEQVWLTWILLLLLLLLLAAILCSCQFTWIHVESWLSQQLIQQNRRRTQGEHSDTLFYEVMFSENTWLSNSTIKWYKFLTDFNLFNVENSGVMTPLVKITMWFCTLQVSKLAVAWLSVENHVPLKKSTFHCVRKKNGLFSSLRRGVFQLIQESF